MEIGVENVSRLAMRGNDERWQMIRDRGVIRTGEHGVYGCHGGEKRVLEDAIERCPIRFTRFDGGPDLSSAGRDWLVYARSGERLTRQIAVQPCNRKQVSTKCFSSDNDKEVHSSNRDIRISPP